MAEYGAPPDACTTSDYPVALTIDAMPLPAPAAPPVLVETEHTIVDSDSLDALVCCDGAIPGRSYGPGSCPALELHDAHPCASLRRLGALAVHHTLDRSALSPAASGNLDRWNAARCETWPEGAHFDVPEPMPAPVPVDEPAATTGCTAGERPPAWLLAGLLCLGLGRRPLAALARIP